MRPTLSSLALIAAFAGPAAGHADTELDLAIALFADAEGGTSLDVDASLAPTGWLTLSAGAGTSDASSGGAELGGTAMRGSIDLHSQRFGVQTYLRSWSDDDEFDSQTLGARAYFRSGGFTAAFIGEGQDLDVGFTVLVLGRPVERSASFESTGVGAGVSYYGRTWGGYLEGVAYDYDEQFDAAIAASRSPGIARFPRVQALVGSVLTLTQGALDHELTAGVERMFSRSSLRLDWVTVEDAIDGLRADSVSGAWRYSFTRAIDLELTLGVSDSETLDSLAFGGVTFMLHR
ncbi:MAG: hypothetical protein ACT4O5_15460 [Gammaproteobacteria bacterium]